MSRFKSVRRRRTPVMGYDDAETLARLRAELEVRLDALAAVIEAKRRAGWIVVRANAAPDAHHFARERR